MSEKPKSNEKKHLHYKFSITDGAKVAIKGKDVYVGLSESGNPAALCSMGNDSTPTPTRNRRSVLGMFRRGERPKYVANVRLDTSKNPVTFEVEVKKKGRVIAVRSLQLHRKPNDDQWTVALKHVQECSKVQISYRLDPGDPKDCKHDEARSITLVSDRKEDDDEPKGADAKP